MSLSRLAYSVRSSSDAVDAERRKFLETISKAIEVTKGLLDSRSLESKTAMKHSAESQINLAWVLTINQRSNDKDNLSEPVLGVGQGLDKCRRRFDRNRRKSLGEQKVIDGCD